MISTRITNRLGAATLTMFVVVAVAVAWHLSGGADDEAHAAAEPAPYNAGPAWPGDDPTVCVEDHTTAAGNTAAGFPVDAAADEYDDLVRMVVDTDCAGYVNVVQIVTINERDMAHSAWWTPQVREDGYLEAGRIELNLAQAFRMDPRSWRLALVHELGHALGLQHTFEGDTVMHPLEYTHHDGLTEADRDQIRELYTR